MKWSVAIVHYFTRIFITTSCQCPLTRSPTFHSCTYHLAPVTKPFLIIYNQFFLYSLPFLELNTFLLFLVTIVSFTLNEISLTFTHSVRLFQLPFSNIVCWNPKFILSNDPIVIWHLKLYNDQQSKAFSRV